MTEPLSDSQLIEINRQAEAGVGQPGATVLRLLATIDDLKVNWLLCRLGAREPAEAPQRPQEALEPTTEGSSPEDA